MCRDRQAMRRQEAGNGSKIHRLVTTTSEVSAAEAEWAAPSQTTLHVQPTNRSERIPLIDR